MALSWGARERRRFLQNLRARDPETDAYEKALWEAERDAEQAAARWLCPDEVEFDADPLLRERAAAKDGAWNE